MGKLGWPEILLILAVVMLLFGGKKIPEMMRGLGKGMKEFKDASKSRYRRDRKRLGLLFGDTLIL